MISNLPFITGGKKMFRDSNSFATHNLYDTQIKLFHFYDSDSSIGANERMKVEEEVNNFMKEHNGNIISVQMQNNNIMVVYKSF